MDIPSSGPPRSLAERTYRFLLYLFPARFRRNASAEVLAIFREGWSDVRRERLAIRTRFWSRILVDLLLVAMAEWALWVSEKHQRPTSRKGQAGTMDFLLNDLRYGWRALRRSPVFAVVAVLTIAIGVGATTTVFSVANAFLLRPPAGVRGSGELITAHALTRDGSSFHSFSYPTYVDLRDAKSGLTALAGYGAFPASLTSRDEPELMLGMIVTGNYFPLLGTRPALGRLLLPSDDRGAGGAEPVAVLSYRTWLGRFSGDSSVLGRSVVLNRLTLTVVGVAEPGFQGHIAAMDVGIWVPMGLYPLISDVQRLDDPHSSWMELIGRRNPAVSRRQIAAALTSAASASAEHTGRESSGIDVRDYAPVPAQALLPVGGFLGILLVICGVVLFIASVNVAGLLLSRATGRSREIAIRLAIGASRGRLVGQLTTESLLLFSLGGAAGIGVAFLATRALAGFAPPVGVPIQFDFHPDLLVLSVAMLVSLIAGVVFGLAPALQSTRPDLAHAIRDEHLGTRFRRSRLRSFFITAQVAGSVLLLVVGGLFGRALWQAGSIDLGFAPAGLHATQVDLRIHHYTDARQVEFVEQVGRALASRGEVARVAAIDVLPLTRNNQGTVIVAEGRDPRPNVGVFETDFASVTPGYLATMRIPIDRGRDFSPEDRTGAPAVAIVNETLAQQIWGKEDPLGKRVSFGSYRFEAPIEIIGVARDSKYRSLGEERQPMFYLPFAQHSSDNVTFVVRSSAGATQVAHFVRDAIREADSELPLLNNAPVTELIGVSLLPNRIAALVAGLFGAIGLILAAVGLYGLLSYAVSRRRREIGIRMALGAAPKDVRRLVLAEGIRLTAIGLAVGFALAIAATRLLRSLLFGVSPVDPVTFGAIAVLLGTTAFIACAFPAYRATRTDPLEALRHE